MQFLASSSSFHTISFYRPMFTTIQVEIRGQLNYSRIIPSISVCKKHFYQTG